MASNFSNRKYSREHIWISVEGEIGTCGITDFAQKNLTDILLVELPEIGFKAAENESVAEIESAKSMSEIFSPVAGEIIEINNQLSDTPELVNSDPYGDGWIFKIKIEDAGRLECLMSEADYDKFLQENSH